MSSSRVQTTLIGAPPPTAFATWTASETKSLVGVARRPNPPPRNMVWIFTCSGFKPVIFAVTDWSMVWNWVPVHTSAPSGAIRTVQLRGSIGACAR